MNHMISIGLVGVPKTCLMHYVDDIILIEISMDVAINKSTVILLFLNNGSESNLLRI